jgi:hypothetical protein
MDEIQIDREGIDKLQQLLPTPEELKLIEEHQELSKDLPLGQFVTQLIFGVHLVLLFRGC